MELSWSYLAGSSSPVGLVGCRDWNTISRRRHLKLPHYPGYFSASYEGYESPKHVGCLQRASSAREMDTPRSCTVCVQINQPLGACTCTIHSRALFLLRRHHSRDKNHTHTRARVHSRAQALPFSFFPRWFSTRTEQQQQNYHGKRD